MAATVVNALTASHWSGHKPSGYKGQDLDKALKAWEGVAGKAVNVVTSSIAPVTKNSVSAIDGYIAELKQAMTVMEKAKEAQSACVTALKAVVSAAGKASSDLTKLSKGKDVDESEYKNAATSASSIASIASDQLSRRQ